MPRKFDAMDFLTQPSRKSTFWYFSTMIHLPFIPWYTETKSSLVGMPFPNGNGSSPGVVPELVLTAT